MAFSIFVHHFHILMFPILHFQHLYTAWSCS